MAADPELDDVAFLSGGEENVRHAKSTIIVCSQKRALCVAGLVCGSLLLTALIIAFGGQPAACPCTTQQPPDTDLNPLNDSEYFKPIATNGEPFPWLNPYLPTQIQPLSYAITIHPNLTTYDVKGQVTIELAIEEETPFIVINSQNLNITERAITTSNNKGHNIKIIRLLEFPPRQQIFIEFKEKLKKKYNYTLNLRWYSRLNLDPDGFYLDHFETTNGAKRSLAATVFQSHGARKYFPCFNEPHFRTPFRVSIFRDRFHIGLSNSNVYKTDDVGFYMGTGLLRDDFRETPPMPTDAIGWVISDFDRKSLDTDVMFHNTTKQITIKNSETPKTANSTRIQKKVSSRSIVSLSQSLNSKISVNNTARVLKAKNYGYHQKNLTKGVDKPSYTFYAPGDLLSQAQMLMRTAKDAMSCLESWVNLKYPLTKLDFIALPSLDKNVISSLGLISLKISFLTDQRSSTTEESQLATLQVSKAIVRQFIGGITSSNSTKENLIWDGLVKYLAILVLSSLQQHWPLREMYILHFTTKTMDIDALQGWSSISNATNYLEHVDEFYIDKTVAVFGMLHSAVGESRFKKCLGMFLKENYFKTNELQHFWKYCNKTQVSHTQVNVEEMMNLWMNQQGFPLVSVSRSGNNISLSQTPFKINDLKVVNKTGVPKFQNTDENAKRLSKMKWHFPLTYVTNKINSSGQIWMGNKDVSFQVAEDTTWIKLNYGQTGFYRVNYNQENWMNLADQLVADHEIFKPEDRVGLLSDAFTLCHANLMSCDVILKMISYLPHETKWGPVTVTLRHLEKWRRILKYSECFLMLSEFVKIQLRAIIGKLNYTDDGSIEVKMMRPEILLALALWEDEEVIATSKQLFNQTLIEKNGTLAPNLREAIYTGAILSGEYNYWRYCWEKFLSMQISSENYSERMQLVRALGRTKDVWLQNRLLSHVTELPTPEVVEVLQSIAGTPVGGAIACRFLQASWFDLQSRLGKGSVNFAKVISIITQYGSTDFDYDEVKSLVHRFGTGSGLEILYMTVRTIASNVDWVKESQSSLYHWIEQHIHDMTT